MFHIIFISPSPSCLLLHFYLIISANKSKLRSGICQGWFSVGEVERRKMKVGEKKAHEDR